MSSDIINKQLRMFSFHSFAVTAVLSKVGHSDGRQTRESTYRIFMPSPSSFFLQMLAVLVVSGVHGSKSSGGVLLCV